MPLVTYGRLKTGSILSLPLYINLSALTDAAEKYVDTSGGSFTVGIIDVLSIDLTIGKVISH